MNPAPNKPTSSYLTFIEPPISLAPPPDTQQKQIIASGQIAEHAAGQFVDETMPQPPRTGARMRTRGSTRAATTVYLRVHAQRFRRESACMARIADEYVCHRVCDL